MSAKNVESLPPLPLWRFVTVLAEAEAQDWGAVALQGWVDRLMARGDDVLYHRAGGMGTLESWVAVHRVDLDGKMWQVDVQHAIWKLNADAGNDKTRIDPLWTDEGVRFFRNGGGDEKWIDEASFARAQKYAKELSARPESRAGYGTKCVAKDGCRCNSREEVQVDDWLSDRGIEHDKEPKYPPHPLYNKNGLKRADWRVGSTWVEYAGLLNQDNYAKRMKDKIELARSLKLDFMVILSEHLTRLDEVLEARLGKHRNP